MPMIYDAENGDRGVLVDCDTGNIIPLGIRCCPDEGWYEAYKAGPDGHPYLDPDDPRQAARVRKTGVRIRFIREE
jgi:hypothetical protein